MNASVVLRGSSTGLEVSMVWLGLLAKVNPRFTVPGGVLQD